MRKGITIIGICLLALVVIGPQTLAANQTLYQLQTAEQIKVKLTADSAIKYDVFADGEKIARVTRDTLQFFTATFRLQDLKGNQLLTANLPTGLTPFASSSIKVKDNTDRLIGYIHKRELSSTVYNRSSRKYQIQVFNNRQQLLATSKIINQSDQPVTSDFTNQQHKIFNLQEKKPGTIYQINNIDANIPVFYSIFTACALPKLQNMN
ncbi:hypothetical protein [Halanaerobaculum tunisiense]